MKYEIKMDKEDLSKFTDILDEICDSQTLEICDSQPLSLVSSKSTQEAQECLVPKSHRPPKCTGQMGNFRSVEEIDPKYRHIFTYSYFNIVQSNVIEDALYSDKSIVVCAPTGSGKTVIFEMAIVQLLMELEDKNYTGDFKIIYMAPVKALCTERLTEWHTKFTQLGLLSIEVTGDTDIEFPQLKPYSIIITTPEKWDMLTRRWKDHRGLVEVVKLFLIDEVHILNDEMRGPVLEAVVSRMKTIQTSVQAAYRVEQLQAQLQGAEVPRGPAPRVRFVAVSATVSNPEDVAAWLGSNEQPAACYRFGDEYRPVKLKHVVEGYPCPAGTSIFKFDIMLNYKLWSIIQKYYNGNPTLIFCNTRKGVVLTAETLAREITVSFNEALKSKLVALASTLKDKKVQSLILCGVGYHHAGLLYEERTNIEQAFRNRDLPILVTTTTLAMGVNLPAHLVIIKNTQQYVNGAYQEYSISTVLQMVGRAGRPQYDTEATAVIMTRLQDKARYQSLVGGCEPLQSYLHKRLAENLNSEAALGSVCDVAQCVQWVNSTFLSVRAVRDPKRYLNLAPSAPAEHISHKIEELCVRAMNRLASAGLITMDDLSCIESTEAGRLMSLYYIDLETMKLIMKLEGTESLERLLWLVCECHELSDMHLRVDERRCLNALNRNRVAATIRFPMKGKISSRQMKLSCIIQAVLGCLPIANPALNQEAMKIMKTAVRVCKCLVSYVTRPSFITENPKFFTTILNSVMLAKCITANLWENSPYVSRQLKGIGSAYSALLASAGKTNFMVLEESHPRDLERIMNKNPPAGNILRKQISLLPKYNLTMTPTDANTVRIQLTLLNQAHLAENVEHLTAGAHHKSYIIVGDSENYVLYFAAFKESNLISVYDGCMTFDVTRKHTNEHKIIAHCISSTFVGLDVKCEYVFVDTNPSSKINIINEQIPVSEALDKPCPMKQTTITGVFKERKRKCLDKEDITSKEKRKRDNNLIEKLKSMKKSLEKSENTKQDFKCNPNVSHHLVPHLNNSTTVVAQNQFDIDIQHDIQNIDDAFLEDFDIDDIRDDQVTKISSEKSIEDRKQNNSIALEVKSILSEHDRISYIPKNTNERYENSNNLRYRKKINKKNNFAFLNVLENKDNDEIDIGEKEVKPDFSEVIKSKIEKYLQETRKKHKIKNSVIDILDSSNVLAENTNTKDTQNFEIEKENLDLVTNHKNMLECNTNKNQLSETSDSPNSLTHMTLTNVPSVQPGQSNLITYKDENKNLEKPSINLILKKAEKEDEENSITLLPGVDFAPYNVLPNARQNKEAQTFIIIPQNAENGVIEKTNTYVKNVNCKDTNKLDLKSIAEKRDETNVFATKTVKHVITKVKLDLDISEIVYNSDQSTNTRKPNPENTNNTQLSLSRLYCQTNFSSNKFTTMNKGLEWIQIGQKFCHSNGDKENVFNPELVEFVEGSTNIIHEEPMKKIKSQFDKPIEDIFYGSSSYASQNVKYIKATINRTYTNQNTDTNKLIDCSRTDTKQNSDFQKAIDSIIVKSSDKDIYKSPQKTGNLDNNDLFIYNSQNVEFHDNNINIEQANLQGIMIGNVNLANNNDLFENGDTIIPPPPDINVKDADINSVLQKAIDNPIEKLSNTDIYKSPQMTGDLDNNDLFIHNSQNIEFHDNNINVEQANLQGYMSGNVNLTDNNGLFEDGDIIIPPPPEFRDDNTYSPIIDDILNKSEKFTERLTTTDTKLTLPKEDSYSDIIVDITAMNNSTISNDVPRNTSVKDVLQKYSNIFKREKMNNVINYNTKNNKCNNSDSQETKHTIKSNRKYKIRDIDKIDIPLPNSLFGQIQSNQKMPMQQNNLIDEVENEIQPNIHSCYNKHIEQDYLTPGSDNDLNTTNYEVQQSYRNIHNKDILDYSVEIPEIVMDIEDEIEEKSPELLSPTKLNSLYSPDEYNINEAILDPKTLLERLNKTNEEETLTEPTESFDNNKSYSPMFGNNSNDQESAREYTQDFENLNSNYSANFETSNVFENSAIIDLTPSKEVETWTLSPENVKAGLHSDSFQSFTMMHQKRTENKNKFNNSYISNHSCSSRRAKLSHFKYERKRVFKKM